MKWTRPEIRRHFDFQGEDEENRKLYIITLQITNKDTRDKIAAIHIPFRQDGWSMEVLNDFRQKVTITLPAIEDPGKRWECRTEVPELEGAQKGLVFAYDDCELYRKWDACLQTDQTATITLEALVTCHEPLIEQTLTLRYFPDLRWRFSERTRIEEPVLKPSLYYSSNLELEELEKGQFA